MLSKHLGLEYEEQYEMLVKYKTSLDLGLKDGCLMTPRVPFLVKFDDDFLNDTYMNIRELIHK